MDLKAVIDGPYLRFDVTGKLDSVSAPEFEEAVLGGMEANPGHALFDLEGLTYISSSGLRVFLQAAKAARMHNKRVVLNAIQPQVKDIFNLAGFTQYFTFAGALEEALTLVEED